MPSTFLDGLNDQQLRAVISTAPVILNLAGAGSGKTTVLTRRVAYLNTEKRVGTTNMLALTFTRLAGKEMKERVMRLIGEEEGKKLFCNTFHAFAVNVLRRWGHYLGIEDNFTIYDQEDRDEILKRIILEFGNKTSLKKVVDRQEGCGDYRQEQRKYPEECRVLIEYGYRCKQNNAVDLNRLIDLVVRLWELRPEVLAEYQQNYTHVFVDEFQDTNDEQMRMIELLAPQHLFVVGDDFQAIYGWRHARVEYILNFAETHPGCEVIKLEDNYRSTDRIVAAANTLIKHNQKQTEKKLIAHKSGPDVQRLSYKTASDEAITIARMIDALNRTESMAFKDVAILARTNVQVDSIARYLEKAQVPVQRIIGRDDPYKTPAVKPVMNWLYFMFNRKDNIALKKCLINIDARSTFSSELQQIELEAAMNDISLYEAMQNNHGNSLASRLVSKVQEIEKAIEVACAYFPSKCFAVIREIISLDSERMPYGWIENIQKTEQLIAAWEKSKEEVFENSSVQAFLKHLRYRDIQEKLIEERNAVKVMTVHASKGLEFDTVFIVGMNQDVFPSKRGDIEEERRLCYVALTRAKNRLYVSFTQNTSDWNGQDVPTLPSQFLTEMFSKVG